MVPLGMWTTDNNKPSGAHAIMSQPVPVTFELCDSAAMLRRESGIHVNAAKRENGIATRIGELMLSWVGRQHQALHEDPPHGWAAAAKK